MSRRGENIYKRKDGRWEGRYIKGRDSTGKALYGYVYCKSYHEVKEALLQKTIHASLSSFETKDTSIHESFENLASQWFANLPSGTKESTKNKYNNLLRLYILPVYGEKQIDSIDHDFIDQQCSLLLQSGGKSGNGLSTKTVCDSLTVIRSILKYSAKKGLDVPCDGTSVIIKQKNLPIKVLSKTEQETLCRYLSSNLSSKNIGVLICLFTGLRIGEVCALRWNDISFSEGTIFVHNTLQRIQDNQEKKTKVVITSPKSICSVRVIPLPSFLIRLLKEHSGDTNSFVLSGDSEQFVEPRTMQYHFRNVQNRAGIKQVNFHALRHTFATRCVEAGFDIKSLSEILGHSSVNITMNRYVHPTLDLKKDNMDKLNSLYSPSYEC